MLLKIWQISQKNHCVGAFFKYVTGLQACNFVKKRLFLCLRPATLSKKRLWHRCFPVNVAKFRRRPRDDCFWILRFWICFLEKDTSIAKISCKIFNIKNYAVHEILHTQFWIWSKHFRNFALRVLIRYQLLFKTQLIKSDFVSQSCDKNICHLISKKHETISTLNK